jgi:hypothetical protein
MTTALGLIWKSGCVTQEFLRERLSLVVIGLHLLAPIVAVGGQVFIAPDHNSGSILRLDDTGLHVIVARYPRIDGNAQSCNGPQGIAVDPVAETVYWPSNDGAGFFRARFDGTNLEQLTGISASARAIAVDIKNKKLYWDNGPALVRSNLNGGDTEGPVIESVSGFRQIAFDPLTAKIYWNDGTHVKRADADGSNIEDIFVGTSVFALDTFERKMYFAYPSQELRRADLDGSNQELVLSHVGLVALAVDSDERRVYWSDGQFVRRVALDGLDPNDPGEVVYDGTCVAAIAVSPTLVPEPSTFFLMLVGLAGACLCRPLSARRARNVARVLSLAAADPAGQFEIESPYIWDLSHLSPPAK